MKAWFSDFDQTNDAYTETLIYEPDIAAASSYYDTVYDTYMDQLDSLNSAMDSLTAQAPVVVENTVPGSTLSAISLIVNLPRMDLEPFDGTVSKYQRFHGDIQTTHRTFYCRSYHSVNKVVNPYY